MRDKPGSVTPPVVKVAPQPDDELDRVLDLIGLVKEGGHHRVVRVKVKARHVQELKFVTKDPVGIAFAAGHLINETKRLIHESKS